MSISKKEFCQIFPYFENLYKIALQVFAYFVLCHEDELKKDGMPKI